MRAVPNVGLFNKGHDLPTEIWHNILTFLTLELPDYKDVEETSQKTMKPPKSYVPAESITLS